MGFLESHPPPSFPVALAHHWLVGMRGGERVLEQLGLLFPGVPIYTLVANRERLSPLLRSHPLVTSWLQRLPGAASHYRKLLPLFPWATAALRVDDSTQLVISSDASVIKGLTVPAGCAHICYCHSPPRYLWDMQAEYLRGADAAGPLGRMLFKQVTPYVRDFDHAAAERVTYFIANSAFVQQRIRQFYGRESQVIHPPVEISSFSVREEGPDDFYLIVSQLVSYKRIDLAIDAFNKLKLPLVVIGEGSEKRRLQQQAGRTVTFLGSQPLDVVQDHYRRCRAFIFPGIEDFGITPLEAQAAGRPVIAFRGGGVVETVVDGATGIFFDRQQSDCLIEAVEQFERRLDTWDPTLCRRQAEKFAPERFRTEFRSFLKKNFPPLELDI